MKSPGWKVFLELCTHARNEKELDELLTMFLTPEEKLSLSGRALIIRSLLQKNCSQREMAEELDVSIAKITRGSNELKRVSPELMDYLEKILKTTG